MKCRESDSVREFDSVGEVDSVGEIDSVGEFDSVGKSGTMTVSENLKHQEFDSVREMPGKCEGILLI